MQKSLFIKSPSMLILLAVFLMVTAGCGEKAGEVGESPTGIDFVTDYASALEAAAQKEQNIVIDFYTDWCQWCKRLDTVTYVDSSVIEFSKTMVFAKINAEVDTVTAKQYSIPGYPTIVLLKSDGTEIDRIGGYLPPDEFIETINNYLQDIGTLNDYLRKADTSATTEVNFVLAEKYESRKEFETASSYYEKVIEADPDNNDGYTSDAMIALGSLKIRDKKYDESIEQFKKVIKEFEGTETATDAELWIAYAFRKKGDTAAAISTYEDFLKNHPDSPDTASALKWIDRLKNPPPPEEES